MAESAFRESLRRLLEKELGFKVERWRAYDESGIVFEYPSEVEIDVAVSDEKLILIEVSSHVRASDVLQFRRKAELYQRKTGRRPDRLVMVTPYIDERALEGCKAARDRGVYQGLIWLVPIFQGGVSGIFRRFASFIIFMSEARRHRLESWWGKGGDFG